MPSLPRRTRVPPSAPQLAGTRHGSGDKLDPARLSRHRQLFASSIALFSQSVQILPIHSCPTERRRHSLLRGVLQHVLHLRWCSPPRSRAHSPVVTQCESHCSAACIYQPVQQLGSSIADAAPRAGVCMHAAITRLHSCPPVRLNLAFSMQRTCG